MITIRCTRSRGPCGFWKLRFSPRPGERCRYHAQFSHYLLAIQPTAVMAKDSDKFALLYRRKTELDHAIRHEFARDAIERRANKLRSAAIGVAKSQRGAFAHVSGCTGHKEWLELKRRWEEFSVDEILEISEQWPSQPTIRHVRLEK